MRVGVMMLGCNTAACAVLRIGSYDVPTKHGKWLDTALGNYRE